MMAYGPYDDDYGFLWWNVPTPGSKVLDLARLLVFFWIYFRI
jgi:hypothetical protein